LDSYRKPVNSKERLNLIKGKPLDELFPYYGATGQVGWIDSFLTDGEYILLGEDGAPFLNPYAEKAYIIYGKTWVNNHAHILRSKTNNEFLCYYLNYFNYKNYVSGTTRLKLTQAQMRKIPIPNIPSDEQSRIVASIEELFSELDKAVDTLKTTKEQLEVYRQTILVDAFRAATNSTYLKVGCVCAKIVDCPHSTPKWEKSGKLCLRTTNFKRGYLDLQSPNYVSEETFHDRNRRIIPQPGDVLYSREGSVLGIACTIPSNVYPAWVNE
jgi:type I restriction enzyme S subunit